jgi:seryl-tRNA synthetase
MVALDLKWRKFHHELDYQRKLFNELNKLISKKKKDGVEDLHMTSKIFKNNLKNCETFENLLNKKQNKFIMSLCNQVDITVPISKSEVNNRIERVYLKPSKKNKLYNHVDLAKILDIVSFEEGYEVAGSRGYYLKNEGVLLNQAIINYALKFMGERNYELFQTPFFMRKSIMTKCAQLSEFDDELYQVLGGGEDLYLIATSEQSLCAYYSSKQIERTKLPLRIAGFSSCFRREAGSHGKDTLGMFRVHQFEKVEQFVLCDPGSTESWKMHKEMICNSEEFYQSLGFSYRIVNIVSGALNDAASKKYDLEAWFPASKKYRELVSCSNCSDFQAKRLEIRLCANDLSKKNPKRYVHMLNSTLTATERTICCLLENWQTSEGVQIPVVLRDFMLGIDFIPFRKKNLK